MSKNKKDVITLTDDDFANKKFKTAPGGKYTAKLNLKQTKIKPGKDGNVLQLVWTLQGKKVKGVNVFDNIAAHVGWKIAQILKAYGLNKAKAKKIKSLTDLLKFLKTKGEVDVLITEKKWQGKPQNKVTQYLPAGSETDDDDLEEDDDDEDDDDEDSDDEDEDSEDEDDEDDDEEDDDEDEDDEEEEDDEDEEEDDDEEDEEEDEDEDEDEDDEDEEDEDEEEEDDDDDEDEEEEKPKRRRKSAAKKKVTRKRGGRKTAKRGRGKKK